MTRTHLGSNQNYALQNPKNRKNFQIKSALYSIDVLCTIPVASKKNQKKYK